MNEIRKELEQDKAVLIALRRDFHRHPELSLQEFRTAQRIEEELDRLDIPHTRVGETGVLGTLRGTGSGDGVMVLRADMDALPIQEANSVDYCSQTPGVMHACGHDANVTCLLGAAKVLARRRDRFGGEVRLVFQPAEEIGQGAKAFVDAGVLDGATRVFGLHAAPELPSGSVGLKPGVNNAAVDHFWITVQGKSTHVCSPQLGIDALYIASQIVVALQALVTRRTAPIEPVILGVGTLHAGTTYNALAESAELEGTTRTVSRQTREQLRAQVEQTAESIAGIYGGTAAVRWTDCASSLVNDPQACQEATAVVDQIFGPGRVTPNRKLSPGGDNFAEYLLHTTGCYAFWGTGNPDLPNTQNPVHSVNFDIDEDTLVLGAGLYAGYTLSVLGT